MPIKKEKLLNKITSDFAQVKNLLFIQFEILEEAILNGIDELGNEKANIFNNNEKEIDQFEIKISDRIIESIVLHQPMASELRQTVAYFRILTSMERIGDQMYNIYKFIEILTPPEVPTNQIESILHMLSISQKMLRRALRSFEEEDKDYAIWTIKNDEIVDELQHDLINRMVKRNAKDEIDKKQLLNIINLNNILNSIERIADNATNIAEASIYYQEGIDLRHKDINEVQM